MNTHYVFIGLVLIIVQGACDTEVSDALAMAEFAGQLDDGRSISVMLTDHDRVALEVGSEESFDGIVEDGAFIAMSSAGTLLHGHIAGDVSGFLEQPGEGNAIPFTAQRKFPATHHRDEVAVATRAVTAGSSCTCVWVLGTSHYHCTVGDATKCYGKCPGT